MNFKIKKTTEKDPGIYKTLYIKERLAKQIEQIATDNHTSWNNVVISMIESCLEEE